MLTGSCHCGSLTWSFDGTARRATSCNCSICRRYGVLWLYGYEAQHISVSGDVESYRREDLVDQGLSFNFCPKCGCMAYWRSDTLDANGRRRIAVNLRLSEPETVAHLEVRQFDGLKTWADLPRDGQTVNHVWHYGVKPNRSDGPRPDAS